MGTKVRNPPTKIFKLEVNRLEWRERGLYERFAESRSWMVTPAPGVWAKACVFMRACSLLKCNSSCKYTSKRNQGSQHTSVAAGRLLPFLRPSNQEPVKVTLEGVQDYSYPELEHLSSTRGSWNLLTSMSGQTFPPKSSLLEPGGFRAVFIPGLTPTFDSREREVSSRDDLGPGSYSASERQTSDSSARIQMNSQRLLGGKLRVPYD